MGDGNRFNRFINRHLDAPISNKQKIFDVLFGVVAPVLCLVLDPFIFSDMFYMIRIGVYIAICIGSITLILWLFLPETISHAIGLVTGVLYLGYWSAMLLGFGLTPFSLIGLIFIIGIFGFTPYLTAFCYLRSARRAMKMARQNLNEQMLKTAITVGVVITLGISMGGQRYFNHITSEAMETILSGDESEVQGAIDHLQKAFWCRDKCYDDIVWAFHRTDDEELKARYQQVYQALTGDDIEVRLRMILD